MYKEWSSLFNQAIRMDYPEKIPVYIGIQPAAWFHYGKELQYLLDQYPQFFKGYQCDVEELRKSLPPSYLGTYVDEWGCVWENDIEGAEGIVKGHPLKCEEDVYALKIPANRDGRLPHGLMYLRLLDLCGFEDAMVYFAEEGETIQVLIDKVLEYNMYQIAATLPRMDERLWFGDDLGIQNGIAIGTRRWRKYMKPCFRKMFGLVKAYNPKQLIYLHSDGCIYEILPDLIECGADMINVQFRANGLDNLVRVCRKERIIPINLDVDYQLTPFATRSQIFEHVRASVEELYLPQGGLGLKVLLDQSIPLEKMANLLDAVDKYRYYKG